MDSAPGKLRPTAYLVLAAIALSLASLARAEDWPAISPADLAMTADPKAPGAPAILLYREDSRNDDEQFEDFFERIKVLTEAGRDNANFELAYVKGVENIRKIHARVIHPNGTITIYDGTPEDKSIVSVEGEKVMAKTFTLPGIEVGAILDVRYTKDLDWLHIYDSHFIINQPLYAREQHFTLVPYHYFAVTFSWPRGLPLGSDAPKNHNGKIEYVAREVPAFVSEEHMPPEGEEKYHIDFVYNAEGYVARNTDEFWVHTGKALFRSTDDFLDEPRAMARAVADIVSATDTPQDKLKKIYERVEKMHNLSFDQDKTQQELDRENLKKLHDVEDVWDRGYGSAEQLTNLYIALVRAAGLPADPVLISSRDRYFFNRSGENANELNTNVALVHYGDNDLYVDPGVPYLPFGLLPWYETGVQGLRLDKNGGQWVTTFMFKPGASHIEHDADLVLEDNGSLKGDLTVTYTGLEAANRRFDERNEDEQSRAKYLEDEVRGWIPTGIEIHLVSAPDWDSDSQTMSAKFELSLPGWSQRLGRRLLVGMGLFDEEDRHTFEHAERIHPIYFHYHYQRIDNVNIKLPQGYKIESLPAARDASTATVGYHFSAEQEADTIHVHRAMIQNTLLLPVSSYAPMRAFYDSVRSGDEQQAIIVPDNTPAGK